MSMTPQKQEKKIIDSEIKNILNPVIILFWTRMVILPSLDSTSKSLDQLVKTKGNTILAISYSWVVISLNHTAIINRKAEIGNKDGHRRSPGIKKGFEVDLSQLNYIKYIGFGDYLDFFFSSNVNSSPELSHNILFALL